MRSAGHPRARLRTFLAAAVVLAIALAVAVALTRAQTAKPVLAASGSSTKITTPVPGFLRSGGRFTTVDFPGGALNQTLATGVNDFGTIVGDFDDDNAVHHGYVRTPSGKCTQVDFPGAVGSTLSAVNNKGQMAGRYSLLGPYPGGGSPQRSFLLYKDKFTKIDFPNAAETQATGINNLGQVVGQYTRKDGTFGSFLWQRGRITDIDVPQPPGSIGATVTNINDKGELIGSVGTAQNAGYGFLLSRGRFTTIKAPGEQVTVPFGINNRGQISGSTYRDGTQLTAKAFLLAKGAKSPKGPFTQFKFPGTIASVGFGLNNLTQVVGAYANPAVFPPGTDVPQMPRMPLQ